MKPRRIYNDLSLYQRRSKHARRFAVAIVMPALRLAAAKKNPGSPEHSDARGWSPGSPEHSDARGWSPAPREEIPRSGAG